VGKRFSFSQLETYRFCPLKYLYAYVYRIPVRPVPHLAFGTDLQRCLEQFYAGVMEGRGAAPVEGLLASFRRLHAPGRYGELAQDREYRQLGDRILTEFYKKQEGSFTAPLFVEKSFLLEIGDVLLKGVVDRADRLEGGGVEIVDYKSGKPKEKLSSEDQLQLRLYALAAKEVFGLDPRRLSFYYLRENRSLSFEQKPSDFGETRERILELAAQVQSGDFTPSPSKVKCRGCDFKALCPASLA
jgi:DNA helicase-2/ATP-dependent DNA helicase PcrA